MLWLCTLPVRCADKFLYKRRFMVYLVWLICNFGPAMNRKDPTQTKSKTYESIKQQMNVLSWARTHKLSYRTPKGLCSDCLLLAKNSLEIDFAANDGKKCLTNFSHSHNSVRSALCEQFNRHDLLNGLHWDLPSTNRMCSSSRTIKRF